MSPAIIAALISASIALVGYLVSTDKTRRELALERTRVAAEIENATAELEVRRKELAALEGQLRHAVEDMRQEQLTEVLRQRLAAYPALYRILQEYNRMWRFENKPLDHAWVEQFLRALLEFNADHGVLFSQTVYSSFADLRWLLITVEERLRSGGLATESDLRALDGIISGPLNEDETARGPGLGTFMKDDLGSYRVGALSTRDA